MQTIRNQGLQFRPVPPGTGGTYWSARLPVRGPPATERFRQKSTIDSQLREKPTVDGRLRKKKGRRRGQEKKKEGKKEYLAHAPSSPAYRRRLRVACAPSLPAGRPRPQPLFLPCKETERLPTRGERSKRRPVPIPIMYRYTGTD
ncbi:hypothetical protein GW17_00017131 [Ensete ventricosum]|nr:hypothetical protein GW17_00017131 [Ensete ventricosum]